MKAIFTIVFSLIGFLQILAQTPSRFQQPLNENLRHSRIDYALKNKMPLVLIEVTLEYDTAGIPILNLFAQDVTLNVITQYTIEVYCFDKNGTPVNSSITGANVFVGNSQEYTPSLSDVYFPDIWFLNGFKTTARVKVYLIRVKFWDGPDWIPSDKRGTMIESKQS